MAPGFARVLLFVRRFGAVVDALVGTVEALVRVSVVTEFVAFLPEVVLRVMAERAQERTEVEVASGCSSLTVAPFRDGLEAPVDAGVELFFASCWVSVVPNLVAFGRLLAAILRRMAYFAQRTTVGAFFTRFGSIITAATDGQTQR